MRTILPFAIVLGAMAVVTVPASADIIVLNNGQVFTGDVSSDASGRLKLSTDYGEQFFPTSQVAGHFRTPAGREAEAYYQAGLLVLGKGQRNTATQLFQTCIRYDAAYRDRCVAALRGGASPVAPSAPGTPGAPREMAPAVSPAQPQVQLARIQCPECSGTGIVMATTSLSSESGRERPRPCPICGGKGYRDVQIPSGHEVCSDCGGFGATAGGGRSDSSSFILKKDMCPRCAGRGIVKSPWRPPEGDDGTGSPGTYITSPAPGSPPPHTGGAYNVARQQARDVASGGPATRPVGPSSVRPVSPTMVMSPPPSEEEDEEVVTEDEGGPAEAESDEGTDESESESEDSYEESDYVQPGFTGWIGRNKWYVVLGGAAILIFAVVFNKMSARK